MAVRVVHPFVSAIPDSGDTTIVQPSNWNADHTISGLGAGVETFLETPSSANLRSAVTDETGTGSLVFATSPTLVTPALGTPSALVLTNATGLPDAALPTRLGTAAKAVTDYDSATENGYYYAAAAATNSPDSVAGFSAAFVFEVLVYNANYISQIGHYVVSNSSADTVEFMRYRVAGTWGAWFKLMSSRVELDARYQPLDSDLTAIAALTTTSYGRALLALADAAALRSTAGLVIGTNVREVLTADRTYYVRTDGSDSNTGLANTSGGAFLTLQKAFDVIKATLDTAGYTVTIQADGGTYAGRLAISGWTGGGAIVFDGGGGTISKTTSGGCIASSGVLGGTFTYQNVTLTTTAGNGVQHAAVGKIVQGVGTVFGAIAGNAAIQLSVPGAYHENTVAYSITGGGNRHMWVTCSGAYIYSSSTLTITGTPAFVYFADAYNGGVIQRNGTITGSATGQRYQAVTNGVINTLGGGASYLPGNVAGSTATGGQYA